MLKQCTHSHSPCLHHFTVWVFHIVSLLHLPVVQARESDLRKRCLLRELRAIRLGGWAPKQSPRKAATSHLISRHTESLLFIRRRLSLGSESVSCRAKREEGGGQLSERGSKWSFVAKTLRGSKNGQTHIKAPYRVVRGLKVPNCVCD